MHVPKSIFLQKSSPPFSHSSNVHEPPMITDDADDAPAKDVLEADAVDPPADPVSDDCVDAPEARVVCLSDWLGATPPRGMCSLLVVTGDISCFRPCLWLSRFKPFLSAQSAAFNPRLSGW